MNEFEAVLTRAEILFKELRHLSTPTEIITYGKDEIRPTQKQKPGWRMVEIDMGTGIVTTTAKDGNIDLFA